MTNDKTFGLYFHIPFCVRKCLYCDFLSFSMAEKEQDAYMEALFLETAKRAAYLRENFSNYQVHSVYIGGGTPSVVAPEKIAQLLDLVRASFWLTLDCEISMEVNPGTVTAKSLAIYRSAGINRLSIGLQSANDAELKRLGRIHTKEDFLATYAAAIKAGFTNINVDLIGALPGQRPADFKESLQEVLALEPPPCHVSVYSLIIEEETPFYEAFQKGHFEGTLALPAEEEERAMYHTAVDMLKEAGLEPYEISNFARPGFACRHNTGYWQRLPYIGFGLGAASLFMEHRFSNTRDFQAYLKNPGCLEAPPEKLKKEDRIQETLFLGLRMEAGVDKALFYKTFGFSLEARFGAVIEACVQEGLLENTKNTLRLTPLGKDLANVVEGRFFCG